jgi:hypothetical protein
MPTLAFLLAPSTEIPEQTDREWFSRCCGWNHGTYMAWIAVRNSLPVDRRPRREWFDSPNLTTNAMDYMGSIRPEDKESYRSYVAQKLSAWQEQGCPDAVVDNGPLEFCAATQTVSRIGLDQLIGFRGILQPIPAKKLKRGGRCGLLANQGNLFKFETEHELTLLEEITRAYGADALAMWTFGHTVQLERMRARDGAKPQRFRRSLRLARPSDRSRPAALLERLKEAFAGSALTPDWKAVEGLLKEPQIEIEPWFEAFGLPGAAELVPKNCAALWGTLESVGTALLHGEAPEAASAKPLNTFLTKLGVDKVPSKPGKAVARKLFGAAWELRQAAGLPAQGTRWQERYTAADLYWDITDSAALDKLTVGQDRQGKGLSASLGRLMTYYPGSLRRDNWFWSLAALAAESANGHAFVAGMETLAESAHAAGFTLVIVPADLQAAFREAFGIEGGEPETEKGWAAEAFLDLPGLLKADIVETAGAWFVKRKVSGVVVRCEVDGNCRTLAWKNGKPESDAAGVLGFRPTSLLSEAARAFDISGASRALGFSRLLMYTEVKRTRNERDQGPANSIDLSQADAWPAAVPDVLRSEGAPVLIAIGARTADTGYIEELATDLAGGAELKVRREGGVILGSTTGHLDTRFVAALLGDLPDGSVWAAASQNARFRSVWATAAEPRQAAEPRPE